MLGSLYLQLAQPKPAKLWLEKSARIWREMRVPVALEAQRKKELAAVQQDLVDRASSARAAPVYLFSDSSGRR
jgi:hypothetical protein